MKKEVVVGIGLLALIFLGLFAASYAFQWTTAPWIGELEKRQQQVGSGEWKIVKYNYYFDMCAAIKGNYEALQTQKELLEQTKDDAEKRRIRQTVSGLKMQIQRDIAQYNADVHKKYTKAKMMDSSLPYTITMEKLERGEIVCR